MRCMAALKRRRTPDAFVGRVSLLLVGSMVATAAYAVTIRANLGLGPLYVLQDGFARQAGVSIGASVTVIGYTLVLVAFALRSWPGPGTLALPFLGGIALNAMLPHIPPIHGWPLRVLAVLLSTWAMALGGATIIRAAVGVAAYDAVMLGLRRVSGRPLAPIRLAMEATALALGWCLGGSVGVGTVITGVLIGPGMQFWLRIIGERNKTALTPAWPRRRRPAAISG